MYTYTNIAIKMYIHYSVLCIIRILDSFPPMHPNIGHPNGAEISRLEGKDGCPVNPKC